MKMTTLQILLASTLIVTGSQAAIIVADNGTAVPTIGVTDTGYTGSTNQRFGWDTETPGQTFTLAADGTLQSIYLGYNAFDNGDTITITLDIVSGGISVFNQENIVLDGDNFSGTAASDDNAGAFYWMQFDLSSENIAMTAGTSSFSMAATANTGDSWALAPRYQPSDVYAGGSMQGLGTQGDLAFAVTTIIPEPGTLSLLGGAMIGLLMWRRRVA